MSIRRVSVRWNRDESWFELRCDSCAASGETQAYWPLTVDDDGRPEFWDWRSGLQKCRACLTLAQRLRRRQSAAELRAKARARYRRTRTARLAWRAAYHAANRDRINAARRERYAAKKAVKSVPDDGA